MKYIFCAIFFSGFLCGCVRPVSTFSLISSQSTPAKSTEARDLTSPSPTSETLQSRLEEIPTQTPSPSPTPPKSETATPVASRTPSWCPLPTPTPYESGKFRLVYISDQDFWFMDEGEEAVQLTDTGDVSVAIISDDGRLAAYTRRITHGSEELWITNLQNLDHYRLISVDEFTALRDESDATSVISLGLTWIPGTHQLAFNTYPVVAGGGIWIYIPDDIWMIEAERGAEPVHFPFKGGFTFSPDGKQMAIYDPEGISLVNTDGTNYRPDVLEAYRAIGFGESYYYPFPFWSEDSSSFILPISTGEYIYSPEALVDIWEVYIDEKQPRKLGTYSGFPPSVVVSPDQKFFAYWRWPDAETSDHELHIATIDGKEDVLYAKDELVEFLAWSSDSQQFLYPALVSRKPYLGNICGEPQVLSSLPPRAIYAKWVDAYRYLYLNGNNDLQVLHLMSGDDRQVIAESKLGDLTFDVVLMPGNP